MRKAPTYRQAQRAISELTNFEKELPKTGSVFKQNNTRAFIKRLAKTIHKTPIVHIAGTKGKGSTGAMIEALFRASGLRTGLFTSPHLIDQRERIQIDRKLISKQAFARHVFRVIECKTIIQPTYFELMTYVAVLEFIQQKVDIIILETGLGGRLDTTNGFPSWISVITKIDKDHCKILGNTYRKIAKEKAGIIKQGNPTVALSQRKDVNEVIKATCKKLGSKLTLVSATKEKAPLPGNHQRENWALAKAAYAELHSKLSKKTKQRFALKDIDSLRATPAVTWKGRFDIVQEKPPIVLDGAHTAHSIDCVIKTWHDNYSQTPIIIYGSTQDKDWKSCLKKLLTLSSQIYLCTLPSKRSEDLEKMASYLRTLSALEGKVQIHQYENFESAIQKVGKSKAVLVTGSLYLVGDALDYFNKATASKKLKSK